LWLLLVNVCADATPVCGVVDIFIQLQFLKILNRQPPLPFRIWFRVMMILTVLKVMMLIVLKSDDDVDRTKGD
jgi:hypothetical protein